MSDVTTSQKRTWQAMSLQPVVSIFNTMKTTIWAALSAAMLFSASSGCAQAQKPANPLAATGTQAKQPVVNAEGKPFLHPLFSENAVLQRDRTISLWGWTFPGTTVSVQLDAQKQTARAGADGRWSVSIPPHTAGGPHTLRVSAPTGESEIRRNLLFGDVWLCSGQSNMAYDYRGALNPEAERAAANYPNLRLLRIPGTLSAGPQQTFTNATWKVCTPDAILDFAGTGYFFGRDLHQKLKVPIGLIDSSASGTVAQAWVSAPSLSTMEDFKPAVDALRKSADATGTLEEQMTTWWQNDAGTASHQEATDFDDSGWKTITAPGNFEGKGFPNFDGVMWLRRTVDVPANWAGRDLRLNLGYIDDMDTTYWNGVQVGSTGEFLKTRDYVIPGALVKAGQNTIAVRVLDTGGGGGFSEQSLSLKNGDDSISLDGEWKAKSGTELKNLPLVPLRITDANTPTVLYNGKIAPLLPAQIKGILWYQGESNGDRQEQAVQYRTLLPLLVNDWRAKFGEKTPFYIVQLANFRAQHDQPNDSDVWPLVREAQLQTSKTLNAPLVVTIDIGEANDVHYKNKQEVGRRLALRVLNQTYGVTTQSSGPTFRSAKPVGGALQVLFDNAQGLNLKGDANRVFAIAGADRKFRWATPKITGDTISLSSPDVKSPQYARFGWSDNPLAILYNGAGLPASPFRTGQDDVAPEEDLRQINYSLEERPDAAFNAWNNAFLVRDNGQTYYARTLQKLGRESEGSWVLALDIEVALDAYERTRSTEHRGLVGELLDTFLKQNSYDWKGNTWNDDMAWMATALIRGFQITGNKAYLDKAAYAWNLAYDRGWDTKYGEGGVWENMDNFVHGDGKADKLALSNTTMVYPGLILYQSTGDPAYLTKSKAMYAWIRKNAFNDKTGQVYEGVKWFIGKPESGWLLDSNNVYNSGSFVQAANALYRLTGDKTYRADATLAIDHVLKTPILANNGGFQTQWQYRFLKALSQFATDTDQWPKYQPWMLRNAEAAWSKRDNKNLTGNNWLEVTNDPKINAMQTSSAAAIWQLLPPMNAPKLSGQYVIQNAASKLPLAVASTANGAPVIQAQSTASPNTVWTFVPTGGGFYQIKNYKSGLVLSVDGASVQAEAKVVVRPAQGLIPGNDRWMPVKNADGTTSFFNHNSKQVLDNPGANVAAGTQFTQYYANDSLAQKFTLTPKS